MRRFFNKPHLIKLNYLSHYYSLDHKMDLELYISFKFEDEYPHAKIVRSKHYLT